MRNLIGLGMVLGTCMACTTPGPPPSMAAAPLDDQTPTCRMVVGQAEIDGTMQQIAGRACRQPDGTWQIMQDADGGAVAVYPLTAYPYYPYYDPWYWGPPVAIGVGGSFIFVDHFHHFHHMDHGHFGHPSGGMGGRGGFHGMGGVRPTGGGMSGGGARH